MTKSSSARQPTSRWSTGQPRFSVSSFSRVIVHYASPVPAGGNIIEISIRATKDVSGVSLMRTQPQKQTVNTQLGTSVGASDWSS